MPTEPFRAGLAVVFAAIVVACSSSTSTPAIPAPDGGGGTTGDAGTGKCYSLDPIDLTTFTYEPPTIQVGACTQADVDNIVKFADGNPQQNFNDLEAEIAAHYTKACHDCIFAPDGATWSPFILDDQGKISDVNSSGCVQIVSGKGVVCGKGHRVWDQCIGEACFDCSNDDVQGCLADVQKPGNPCAKAHDDFVTACGTEANTYLADCEGKYGFDAWILHQCVTGQ